MRYVFVIAVVFAAVCACAGSFTSSDTTQLGTIDASIGSVSTVPDAGNPDGGDGGALADGGCAATPINGAHMIDACGGTGLSIPANISLSQTNCSATISFPDKSTPCTGTINGANDAFDGGCSGSGLVGCNSLSLPGLIICTQPDGTKCSIRVCDPAAGICTL
jgi:hypothetical protein